MQETHPVDNEFLDKISGIIVKNLSNEQFGVSELARAIGMSRSNLLRKVKKLTNLSVSVYIRQVRLENAMALLKEASFNVSEVSFQVGFSSVSYFIKCFHDHYGYPPGEVGKRGEDKHEAPGRTPNNRVKTGVLLGGAALLVFAVLLFVVIKPGSLRNSDLEKSIAVLPFKNDSNDSSNVYLINGLMESLLTDLQKIEDLRVISRTSVEKYRHTSKSIPEIGKELNVSYFVEGSGQKIGDQILLNVQLIEAKTDRHLWAEQYKRQVEDIFQLQKEVAKSITTSIEVLITPDEEERINKIPTENLVAYDYFLQGLDYFYQNTMEGLEKAIPLFHKAIQEDPGFARPYANIAISYFFMDALQAEKKYTDSINSYADKAILLDPQLMYSLVAKAVYYLHTGEYEVALPYLEKALALNPNSARVLNILSDYYTSYVPDTEKYLEYALKGIELDIASYDSTNASFIFLHLSNAFMQLGFVEQAEQYMRTSLKYDPDNLYTQQLRAYILFAKNNDLDLAAEVLKEAFQKDTTRLDILQELGKVYYNMRDYEKSMIYFKRFDDIRIALDLDYYRGENGKIAMVFAALGMEERSNLLIEDFKIYAEADESAYKHLSLAAYYSYTGERQTAINHLRMYSLNEDYTYWLILFLDIDPLLDNIKNHPEFEKIIGDIKEKFWRNHDRMKVSLEAKGLL